MEIDQYKKYKEEVLLRGLTYSSALSDAQKMHKSISDQPLEVTRKTFDRRNRDLYPADPKESVLAEFLASSHSVRINNLLQEARYRDALDAFYKRLRWKSANRVRSANAKIDFDLLLKVFPIVMGEIVATSLSSFQGRII